MSGNHKKKKNAAPHSFLETVIIWGVVAVFAILPLVYFPGRIASYVTSKEYFFIGTVDLLMILWAWLLLVDTRYRLSKKNLLLILPFFLLLLSLTVSALVGVDPAVSFFSIVESGTGLLFLYHVFLFVCIITSIVRVQQQLFLKKMIQATFCASVVLAVATFFTGSNGLVDLNSKMLDGSSGGAMMGNSLLVGAYFIFSLFLTALLMLQEKQLWKKAVYVAGIAVMVFSPIYFNSSLLKGAALSSSYLFLGEARIAVVSLVIGIFSAVCIWLCLQKGNTVRRTCGIIGIVIMVLGAGIAVEKITAPHSSIHAFFIKQSGNRVIDWQESIQGIKAKPLFGWGPENFHVVYQEYFNPIVLTPEHGNEGWALHPHNNTLEILVDGGMVGFLLYLSVVITLFAGIYKLYRNNKIDPKTYALLLGMFIAFIIQQQMIYDSLVSYTVFFSLLGVVAGLSDVDLSGMTNKSSMSSTTRSIIGTAVAVVLLPTWFYLAYLPARKMEEIQQSTIATSDVRTKIYQHMFHSPGSYAMDTDPEFYTDPLLYSYDAQKVLLKSNPLYQKIASQEIQSLIGAVNPLWQEHHYDYHLTLSLVQLENLEFYLTGDPQTLSQADIYAKRGFVLAPTDPELYTAYAQTLVYEKNIVGANALLDKALTLDLEYQSAINFKNMLNK